MTPTATRFPRSTRWQTPPASSYWCSSGATHARLGPCTDASSPSTRSTPQRAPVPHRPRSSVATTTRPTVPRPGTSTSRSKAFPLSGRTPSTSLPSSASTTPAAATRRRCTPSRWSASAWTTLVGQLSPVRHRCLTRRWVTRTPQEKVSRRSSMVRTSSVATNATGASWHTPGWCLSTPTSERHSLQEVSRRAREQRPSTSSGRPSTANPHR